MASEAQELSQDRIEAVAARLTRAQRRTLLNGWEPSGRGRWPLTNALIAKGLFDRTAIPWRFTPLGFAVRTFLQSQSGGESHDH